MEKKDFARMEALGVNTYNRPYICGSCQGMMIFKGVGEYECEKCHDFDYDDYGKARNYIETHPGANTSQIAENTGVSQKSIRHMLKEGRLEIASDSKTFMKCEICGINVRSGRLCDKCEVNYNRALEEKERKNLKMVGYGSDKAKLELIGEKRFTRDDYGVF